MSTSSRTALRLDAEDALAATSSSSDDSVQPEQQQTPEKTEESSPSEEEKKLDAEDVTSSSSSRGRVIEDDDGADHAEESTPPWQPQNVQSTCEFTHTIRDYANKRESGCKKAEYSTTTVDEFGNRWRLIVYVNGNGRASNHHLSLFLQVADADDLPFGWKKAVSYVLTLEHPRGGNLSYAKRNPDKTFKLCPKAIDWGWSQFITSDRIQQEGFVGGDTLTVRASVTVKSSSVTIDEDDAELYLKCAVEEGNVEAVEVCLEHGAGVNCQFKDDLYTPLHTACSSGSNTKGSMEVLNLLLREGADVNASNKWKETPLLIAANNGHHPAVKALLKQGADPSLCSEAGWSALTFAAHKGYDDIVGLLAKAGAPVNCPVTEDSSTPLHKACSGSKTGHVKSVKLLLDAGADVHALNKWRETPLLTAANHGQSRAVEALLAAGADPCTCTDTGWSPLSIAAYKGHNDVVRQLLEEDAPTEEDDPTLSALLQAATKGLPDTVELLLENGADHTVTTKKGDTALSILVEQNLIDAAVDMVRKYNASIPRCSRDRKKVQRARLLINLRMKQQERECSKNGSTDEDDSNEDGDLKRAQHEEESSVDSSTQPKSKRKKKSGKLSAEEKAKAAEQALLMELEREETKAKKEKAEANNKRQRKKERKERERQLKFKEEQARKAKEEREAEERQRLRREKEREEQKAKEQRLIEQQAKERKEMIEHEKALAAKRKEREQLEQRERDQRMKQEQAKKSAAPVNASTGSDRRVNTSKQKRALRSEHKSISPKAANRPAPVVSSRRWETAKAKSPAQSTKASVNPSGAEPIPALPRQSLSDRQPAAVETVPKTTLTPRSNSVWNGDQSSSYVGNLEVKAGPSNRNLEIAPESDHRSQYAVAPVEHPAISLFRREKVAELIARCEQNVAIVDDVLLKRVLYRWTVRAAHDTSPVLDPIIPSWKESQRVVAFFQRQLISESRRGGGMAVGASMEALKEAGASIATYCQNLAREVEQFRQRIEEHLPKDWTDAALGMTVSDSILSGGGAVTTVSWADRAQVFVPSSTFSALRERHVGPASRFLASCFMAKTLYDTKRLIASGTSMDLRLRPRTKACSTALAGVSAELWSDPFTVEGDNVFWGALECADSLFGGQKPFGIDELGGEEVLANHGGSILVFLPLDTMIAASYIQRMLDILDKTQKSNVPVSFLVFVHADSFRDLPKGPSASDMQQLDPRLCGEFQSFVRFIEVLPAGQHLFQCGDGAGRSETCSTSSLFAVLQNDAGKSRFELNSTTAARIVASVSVPSNADDPITASMGLANDFSAIELPLSSSGSYFDGGTSPLSPTPRFVTSDFGTIGGAPIPQPFSPGSDVVSRGSRRGRLFDLVDNGEEDQVDLVSGMLDNLDMDLFQNNSVRSDVVDIEAISLMGIGGPSSRSVEHGQSHQNRFG